MNAAETSNAESTKPEQMLWEIRGAIVLLDVMDVIFSEHDDQIHGDLMTQFMALRESIVERLKAAADRAERMVRQ